MEWKSKDADSDFGAGPIQLVNDKVYAGITHIWHKSYEAVEGQNLIVSPTTGALLQILEHDPISLPTGAHDEIAIPNLFITQSTIHLLGLDVLLPYPQPHRGKAFMPGYCLNMRDE